MLATARIAAEKNDALAAVAARYAVAITPAMEALIDPSDATDPIARQFLPHPDELRTQPHERADPIDDAPHSPLPGLIHRYPDRVLLKLVSACPVYCRFCFRRESVGPGAEAPLRGDRFAAALDYIAARPRIWEAVLSGGDPLVLSPARVAEVTGALAAIDHVKVLRWHTRVPVVDPARVTTELAAALRTPHAATWVAIHANHPREFTPAARAAIARLADAGVALVSQTVLLKGVNDDARTLEALMRAFVENRVKPYYLHHLDAAPGVERFRVSIADGQALMRDLHARASGLCQPTYVLDAPGGAVKAPLTPPSLRETETGYEVRGGDGVWRPYPVGES